MSVLAVTALAERIHAVWRQARERDGWRLGPADADAKRSPYLKPLAAFTPMEWRRERWLALADLLTITNCPQRDLGALRIDVAKFQPLRAPILTADFDAIAMRVHDAWSSINRRLGIDDARAHLAFDALAPAAQARCRANVACDIEAINALTRDLRSDTLTIAACEDMHAEAGMLSQIFAPNADALR